MTEAVYPQCRIETERYLNPQTTEEILNEITKIVGIRRVILNGPSIPAVVPYGPARGAPNPHNARGAIKVGGEDVDLRVQVGTILLELEDAKILPDIRAACEQVFTNFAFSMKEGKFMRSTPTQTDYAKYGPNGDTIMYGIVDPKNKTGPSILQGTK
jgi:methyl-coenzyme M reductase subunit D